MIQVSAKQPATHQDRAITGIATTFGSVASLGVTYTIRIRRSAEGRDIAHLSISTRAKEERSAGLEVELLADKIVKMTSIVRASLFADAPVVKMLRYILQRANSKSASITLECTFDEVQNDSKNSAYTAFVE